MFILKYILIFKCATNSYSRTDLVSEVEELKKSLNRLEHLLEIIKVPESIIIERDEKNFLAEKFSKELENQLQHVDFERFNTSLEPYRANIKIFNAQEAVLILAESKTLIIKIMTKIVCHKDLFQALELLISETIDKVEFLTAISPGIYVGNNTISDFMHEFLHTSLIKERFTSDCISVFNYLRESRIILKDASILTAEIKLRYRIFYFEIWNSKYKNTRYILIDRTVNIYQYSPRATFAHQIGSIIQLIFNLSKTFFEKSEDMGYLCCWMQSLEKYLLERIITLEDSIKICSPEIKFEELKEWLTHKIKQDPLGFFNSFKFKPILGRSLIDISNTILMNPEILLQILKARKNNVERVISHLKRRIMSQTSVFSTKISALEKLKIKYRVSSRSGHSMPLENKIREIEEIICTELKFIAEQENIYYPAKHAIIICFEFQIKCLEKLNSHIEINMINNINISQEIRNRYSNVYFRNLEEIKLLNHQKRDLLCKRPETNGESLIVSDPIAEYYIKLMQTREIVLRE